MSKKLSASHKKKISVSMKKYHKKCKILKEKNSPQNLKNTILIQKSIQELKEMSKK